MNEARRTQRDAMRAEMTRLRAQGLTFDEIGRTLGVSKQYAHQLVGGHNPDGAKGRAKGTPNRLGLRATKSWCGWCGETCVGGFCNATCRAEYEADVAATGAKAS